LHKKALSESSAQQGQPPNLLIFQLETFRAHARRKAR